MLLRFDGAIAGIGTASGTRIVLGLWPRSPFGSVVDAMVERPDGRRVLIAPSTAIADFIAGTYAFDEVMVGPTRLRIDGGCWQVLAGPLRVRFEVGRRTAVGAALTLVPRSLARSAAWCRAVSPLAAALRPGVRSYGTAGNGRREWYGAFDERAVVAADAQWDEHDLGALAPIEPPVHFGFGSAPRRPALVRLTSTVRVAD